MVTTKNNKGFTLIELLVVIAIIAILAAILFPVFAQAREKARVTTCVSNVKEVALAFLQYTEDYDEASPIAFYDGASYGPSDASSNTNGYGGGLKQPSGISNELQPYIKNWGCFACPDDYTNRTADGTTVISTKKQPPNVIIFGLTFAQIYGTSYSLTHESESNPIPWSASGTIAGSSSQYTGYYTTIPCSSVSNRSATTETLSGTPNFPGKLDCDIRTTGETIVNGSWTGSGDSLPSQANIPAVVTSALFTRPSETRLLHENVEQYSDEAPQPGHFHPNGTVYAYMDGHSKFLVRKIQSASGCDGYDWASDYAGSCNIYGLQRAAE